MFIPQSFEMSLQLRCGVTVNFYQLLVITCFIAMANQLFMALNSI